MGITTRLPYISILLKIECENTHLCSSLHKLLTPRQELMCGRIEWEAGSQGKEKKTQQQLCD